MHLIPSSDRNDCESTGHSGHRSRTHHIVLFAQFIKGDHFSEPGTDVVPRSRVYFGDQKILTIMTRNSDHQVSSESRAMDSRSCMYSQ